MIVGTLGLYGDLPVPVMFDDRVYATRAQRHELRVWIEGQRDGTTEVIACQVHVPPYEHRPTPLRFVLHHIQPVGMGGPNVAANRVLTCDTGHYNTHRIQGCLIDGTPPPRGAGRERELAQRGFDEWVTAGRPGTPVYQFG